MTASRDTPASRRVRANGTIYQRKDRRNVARNVRTGTPRPRRFEPLTADEARQFLAAVRNDRLFALYELALRTGLRKGELLGLQWEDLDLQKGTASIRRTLQRVHPLIQGTP